MMPIKLDRYEGADHGSGANAYKNYARAIIIRFGGWDYLYTYDHTGKKHVEEMKRLAKSGSGLASYRSQNIKGEDKYVAKWQEWDEPPENVLHYLQD